MRAALSLSRRRVVTPPVVQFGVIGLGVMGETLALNLEGHGYRAAAALRTRRNRVSAPLPSSRVDEAA